MISPGAIQSALKLMKAPMVRGVPTMAAMTGSQRPFWSETTAPSGGEVGQQGAGGVLGVLGLDAEEDAVPGADDFGRGEGRGMDAELVDGAGDGEASGADGGDVVGGDVDEGDGIAGAGEVGTDRAADGAGAPDENAVGHAASSRVGSAIQQRSRSLR